MAAAHVERTYRNSGLGRMVERQAYKEPNQLFLRAVLNLAHLSDRRAHCPFGARLHLDFRVSHPGLAMYDDLVDNALRNVWYAPTQDRQAILQPARLTPDGGVTNSVQID
jgi:hypothetical protein